MCQECDVPSSVGRDAPVAAPATPTTSSRRTMLKAVAAGGLGAALAAGGVPLLGAVPAWADGPDPALLTRTPSIHPRSDWAGQSCPVRGPMAVEAPGDVRFLLVHHTAQPGNDHTAAQVPGLLRGMYAFHTGPQKGWPDLAYNFLVDRAGGIWEGRAGSLGAPVVPSATGGAQGYAQLACFLGDHTTAAPTSQAQASMISLLAWLARTYGVDTAPGRTITFTSRGSNRWRAGTPVTTRTIEGHRSMSLTTCPGDAAYALVLGVFPAAVSTLNSAPDLARSTAYVRQVYLDLLRREPEDGNAWGRLLATGAPRAAVANAITASPEYRGALVQGAYGRFLGRPAEAAGLAGWVALMGRGLTIERLEAGIISSPEAYAEAGGRDRPWVAALYRQVLGRDGADAELDGWTAELGRDGDRHRLAMGFLLSTEHLEPVVESCYTALLRRPSDVAGRDGWVRAVQRGQRREQIVAGFVASEEYYARTG